MKYLRRILFGKFLLALVGVFSAAPADAQECPRAPGVAEFPPPTVTAADVEAGTSTLREFALAMVDYTTDTTVNLDEAAYIACLFRDREGPFFSGSTYVISVVLFDGRVFLNTNDMSTAGRLLKPEIYQAITAAAGSPPFGNGDNFDVQSIPGASGYAVGFISTITQAPTILLVGFDLQESHLVSETVDLGTSSITAAQVTDRRTLKKFVDEAAEFMKTLAATGDLSANSKVKIAFRDSNGPWRHGPTYLFILNDTGYTVFHGAFPDKFELQIPTNTLRDEVSGQLILPQIIAAAKRPGGGFVSYHFDNPDDESDSADVPKVSYTREVELVVPLPGPGELEFKSAVIIGAGIYGDPQSEKSVASTQGWLARFGRAVGSQAVEMISSRMNSPVPSGAELTLGGRTVNLNENSARSLTMDGTGFNFASLAQNGVDPRSVASLQSANRLALTGYDSPSEYREITMSQLLASSSFHLASAEGEAAGHWSIWGRGARTSFEGGGDAAIEGDVTTAMLGVDHEKGKLLSGVAFSRASGDGGFENEGRSEMEATLTSVHPYLRYTVNERLSMWGILGLGQGEITLNEKVIEKKVETDIEMSLGAFGIRGALEKVGRFDLAVKSDVMLTQMDADAKDGIEAISAETSRFRLMLEASRQIVMESGGTVRPSVEVGLRHDGGDADEGMGVEVGGSLHFTNPAKGLTFEVKARGLIAHGEEDVADWGVSGMIRVAPGQAGRGLALTVQPSVGRITGGATHLWSMRDVSRLTKEEIEDLKPRMRAEVGYGMDAWGGLLTPYAGLSVSENGSGTYRLGSRFKMGEHLSMSLEGDMRERVNGDPVHSLALRGSMRW